MAWGLMAPSHYLNQYWLLISKVLWHSLDNNFASAQATMQYDEFEKYALKLHISQGTMS